MIGAQFIGTNFQIRNKVTIISDKRNVRILSEEIIILFYLNDFSKFTEHSVHKPTLVLTPDYQDVNELLKTSFQFTLALTNHVLLTFAKRMYLIQGGRGEPLL